MNDEVNENNNRYGGYKITKALRSSTTKAFVILANLNPNLNRKKFYYPM